MNPNLYDIPLNERIRLFDDLWDSIAVKQHALELTPQQQLELDRRLDAYEVDRIPGRPAGEAIAEIRRRT
jgi:putative addiction module component (TIGR02574 family)